MIVNLVSGKSNNHLSSNPKSRISFRGKVADEFIKANQAAVQKPKKQSFFSKYMSMPSATLIPAGIFIGVTINDYIKLIKDKISTVKYLKRLGIATVLTFGSIIGLSAFFLNKSNKNFTKAETFFNENNTTSAKLVKNNVNEDYIGAQYDPVTGEISINKQYLGDPLLKTKMKYLLKHELIHAKQFETIARMDDGIEKLNYSCMKQLSNTYKNKPLFKNAIDTIYNELVAEPTHKYDNVEVTVSGYKLPFKKWTIAMHRLMNDKVKTYKDIPMLINKEHYETVRQKLGKLSTEEEKLANKYYEAHLKYKTPSAIDVLNPWSDYYNNILEKEAYAVMPLWARYF